MVVWSYCGEIYFDTGLANTNKQGKLNTVNICLIKWYSFINVGQGSEMRKRDGPAYHFRYPIGYLTISVTYLKGIWRLRLRPLCLYHGGNVPLHKCTIFWRLRTTFIEMSYKVIIICVRLYGASFLSLIRKTDSISYFSLPSPVIKLTISSLQVSRSYWLSYVDWPGFFSFCCSGHLKEKSLKSCSFPQKFFTPFANISDTV